MEDMNKKRKLIKEERKKERKRGKGENYESAV